MSASPDIVSTLVRTTKEFVSEDAFRVVLWFGVGLCTLVCVIRFGIRFACFRRLLAGDYWMLLALLLLISIASVLHRYLGDIYYLIRVQNKAQMPGPDFEQAVLASLRAHIIIQVIGAVGIYAIKLSFLFFFLRLGNHVRAYQIAWWIALVIIVGCLAINLSVIPYGCSFGSISHIAECNTAANVGHVYTDYKVAVSLDVICDAIIICFPIAITWRTKMSLRQKLMLSSIFLLVSFTIGVTVVRGSIFSGVYKDLRKVDGKVIDISWMLFWLYIEYIVSFIIACLISFRSLWMNRKQKVNDDLVELERQQHIAMGRQAAESPRSKWQVFQQEVLDIFTELEGTNVERNNTATIQAEATPGIMTIDSPRVSTTDDSGVGPKSVTSSSHYPDLSKPHAGRDSFELVTKVETNTIYHSDSTSARH
ncbi:hypothetical protein F5Y13DRAFT_189575 [Hypoxylon sp. FL1857]|nr:hypothetical protein F5Y13DRAFT_189575 [Hypoxylon sp. FL1857]